VTASVHCRAVSLRYSLRPFPTTTTTLYRKRRAALAWNSAHTVINYSTIIGCHDDQVRAALIQRVCPERVAVPRRAAQQ